MSATCSPFGSSAEGEPVHRVSLSAGALKIGVLTLGGILQDVRLDGVDHALTLGSPDPEAYRERMDIWGALIGPVANRIGGAAATIGGVLHNFDANQQGKHTLHSGAAGVHRKVWRMVESSSLHLHLRLDLSDGDGGFPGDRRLDAVWRVSAPAQVDLEVTASTTAATILNIAHHPYWNLDGSPDWGGHRLAVAADAYLPTTEETLPTGEVTSVAGTTLDLRTPATLRPPFDHTLCLAAGRRALSHAARLTGSSGVTLDIATTEPGLHLYDGSAAEAPEFRGHGARSYGRYAGLALEPQFWPDAPNHPNFPHILLRPGDRWRHHTRYTFLR